MKPAAERVSAINSTVIARFFRSLNGTPSSTAPNTTTPHFQGTAGARLDALEFAETVSVEVPAPLLVNVTEVGPKLAVTFEVVASIEVTVGVSVTVPA